MLLSGLSTGPRPDGAELKVIDQAQSVVLGINGTGGPTGISSWNRLLLTAVVQGTDLTSRVGRKILLKSWYFRCHLATSEVAAASYGAGLTRFVCVYDKQANGAAPTISDVLGAGVTGTAAPDVTTPINLNNRERFIVLMDKAVYTGGGINTAAGIPSLATERQDVFIKKFKKLDLPVVFNNQNTGTIADTNTGAIHMFVGTTTEATAAPQGPVCEYLSRLRFYDA